MLQPEISLLFDHLYWIRDKILEAAERVPDTLVDDSPVTIRDLRSTLIHELDVEWSWRERLKGIPFEFWGPDGELKQADYADLQAIREHWARDEVEMKTWLRSLTDDELNSGWTVEKPDGLTLWYHLMHLYTHGMQQFSDAAALLTRAGASPGEVDFLEFIQQTRRKSSGG
ncbi:MAG TPA: DinB family protein [Acidimicrobiia bacterium]